MWIPSTSWWSTTGIFPTFCPRSPELRWVQVDMVLPKDVDRTVRRPGAFGAFWWSNFGGFHLKMESLPKMGLTKTPRCLVVSTMFFSCFFHPCFGMMIHSQLAHGVETTKQKCFLVHHPPHRPTTFIQLRVKTKTKPHFTGFHNISQIALVTPDEPESMWKS